MNTNKMLQFLKCIILAYACYSPQNIGAVWPVHTAYIQWKEYYDDKFTNITITTQI